MIRYLLVLLLLGHPAVTGAQEKNLVRQGNQLYQQQHYKEAAAAYTRALQQNPAFVPGSFNLGNALIRQNQYDAARKVMESTAKISREKGAQSGARYNIGNTYMEEQKWQEAIDAYKEALRKNPQDPDAKYNLSYALVKMKKDGGGSSGKDKKDDKQKKDKKDKDKQDQDKQNKDQDKNKGDKQDKQKEGDKDKQKGDGQEDKQQEQQRPEPRPSKLTRQQADNLLNALQQDERKLQDKMQKAKGTPVKVEKDW